MGWCAEFGCQIRDGCDHSMVAGRKACTCPSCAVVCKGRFGGCPEVWAAGPRTVDAAGRAALAAPAPLPPPPPRRPRASSEPSRPSSIRFGAGHGGPGHRSAATSKVVHLDLGDTSSASRRYGPQSTG